LVAESLTTAMWCHWFSLMDPDGVDDVMAVLFVARTSQPKAPVDPLIKILMTSVFVQ